MAKAEIIINALGQKVKNYSWPEYQRRNALRKAFTNKIDLSGKTLVVNHTWGVGDILYSTPALHGLKKKFPTVRIIYLCAHPEILENNPDVAQIMHIADWNSTEEMLDNMDEDWYWLDYDTPLKGGYDYKTNLRTKPGLNEFLSMLLNKHPLELSGDEKEFVNQASTSVISRYKMIALDMYCWHAHVDPPPEEKTVYYYPLAGELEQARGFLRPFRGGNNKVITLLPHASTPYKDYPYWKEVITLCPANYHWLVLDAHIREDENWSSYNVHNVSGAFRIRQSAALIIESDLNCSSDTGLLYPRAARGGKCVVTYGPHEPEPFLHYFPSCHGLRVPHLTKTPGMEGMCSVGCYIDTSSCRTEKTTVAPCLAELEPQTVANKIIELLEA